MNIHEMQTHKWVIPIEENLKLPAENQGYLLVREIPPMKAHEYAADATSGDVDKQMSANKKILCECIVGIFNVTGYDENGQEAEMKDVMKFLESIGTKLFKSLSSFIMNPDGDEEIKN